MAFHVFLRKGRIEEALWIYHDVYPTELLLQNFLLEQDTGQVVTDDILIINGDGISVGRKECVVIKKKE